MTAAEALEILELGARTDPGVKAALILIRGGHPLARAVTEILDHPMAGEETPVPDTQPEGKGSCT